MARPFRSAPGASKRASGLRTSVEKAVRTSGTMRCRCQIVAMNEQLIDDAWRQSLFLDGAFRRPSGGGGFRVLEKATGDELGVAGSADLEDLDAAVEAAGRAQLEWAAQPYTRRAALLRDVAALLGSRAAEVTELIMR